MAGFDVEIIFTTRCDITIVVTTDIISCDVGFTTPVSLAFDCSSTATTATAGDCEQ